jgi:hypothetical protein
VACTDGSNYRIDSVLLATGYRARVEDFLENTDQLFDKHGVPKASIGKGVHEGLYFVGFDNYKLGGILGTIFTDSQAVADHIQQQVSVAG